MRIAPATCLAAVVAALWTVPPILAQDVPESSPDAITAHAEGLRLYIQQDYRESIPLLYRAHELDPTFYLPLFTAALSAGNAGMASVADSLWGVVKENRSQFSDYYQRLIDIYTMRREGGDWGESMVMARSLAEDYPGTKANYNYALWSNQDGRPNNALTALATLDPDREPMKGWFGFFSVKCSALHWTARHDDELACGRDASLRFPDRAAPRWQAARALAALGRVEEVATAMGDVAARREQTAAWSDGGMNGNIGLELWAHGGDEAAAHGYLEEAVAWYEGLPAAEMQRPVMRRQQAYWLYASGRYEEAQAKLEGIIEDLGSTWDRGYLGITSAMAGDHDTAQSIIDGFMAGEIHPNPSVQHYWAGFIVLAMDDVDGAMEHFEHSWANGSDHREPVLLLKAGDHPGIQEWIRPRG
jgi:tetratricopeptide (TPR) repeat protein